MSLQYSLQRAFKHKPVAATVTLVKTSGCGIRLQRVGAIDDDDRAIAVRCTTNMFSQWAILTTTDELNGVARTALVC